MPYRIEKDTAANNGRAIAIIHVGDKDVWLGSIDEDTVDFDQNDHCCLDMQDILEIVRIAEEINVYTFDVIYDQAADQKEE